jgi:hypothetical protein
MRGSIVILALFVLAVVLICPSTARSQDTGACEAALELCTNNCVGSLTEDSCLSVCTQAYNVCALGEPTIEPRNGMDPAIFENCLCGDTSVVMCNVRNGKEMCVNIHAALKMAEYGGFHIGYCGIICVGEP